MWYGKRVRPIDASTPSLGEVQNTSLNSGSDLCKAAALGDLNGVKREIESARMLTSPMARAIARFTSLLYTATLMSQLPH